jgi:hypothetical protein
MSELLDWLSLPELTVPAEGEVEVLVVRAAFLAAPGAELRALGIKEPAMLDRAGDVGVVGLATIKNETGSTVVRLPTPLAAWAVECCAMVRDGGRPFPSRVRFKRYGEAIATASLDRPAPNPVCTLPCPEHLAVFVDESGNTGDAIVHTRTGAFQGQPSFALACVGEASDGARLESILARIQGKHGMAGGELKGRVMKRRPTLVIDLMSMIYEEGVPVFVELMDKWYYVATNITTFVLGKAPWFDLSTPAGRAVANGISDLIVERLGAATIGAYSDFAQAPDSVTLARFEATLREQLAGLKARDADERELLEVAEALTDDAFAAYRYHAAHDQKAHAHLLPEPDLTHGGKPIAMLPHVPSFTNLYARLNKYAIAARTVRVVHDEQLHVDHVLRAYAETLGSNAHADRLASIASDTTTRWRFEPGKFTLNFERSETSAGIQLADIIARFCTQRMNDAIADAKVAAHQATGALGALRDETGSVGMNIVSTTQRYRRFYALASLDQ